MQTSQMIFYFEDPIAFLNTQLRERQKKNPKFSLRAWARQMGYQNPSLLFQVLKGERRLKMDLAMKIATNLGLKGRSLRYFELIVLNGVSQTETERRVFESMLNQLRPKKFRTNTLSLEAFQAASEWYHGAILTMVRLEDFQSDIDWIQNRLGHGLDKKTIREAIDRLLKLGYLVETSEGRWQTPTAETEAHVARPDVPSDAIRQFHKQMIEKAGEAVETQSRDERLMMSGTFTFTAEKLARAEEILQDAQMQIFALSESSPRDELYQLNMQFFRLTKKKPETPH